jgi:glycosyltransferase involved in cell wall biosynthesis
MGVEPTAQQRRAAETLDNVQLRTSRWKLEWMSDPWDDLEAAGEWLLGLETEFDPDLIHLNGYVHGSLPWRKPRIVVGHSCVLSWHEAVYGVAAPPAWERYQQKVARGLQAADLIIAPSRAMLLALDRNYGGLHNGIVIPNGRRFHNIQRPKEPVIFSAGRLWDPAKNIGMLGRIADRISWPICVAGDCRSPEGQTHKFSSIRLLGQLAETDMEDWYSKAAIFALPARYEPFGLAPLEAALSGCTLVLGDIPSLREVWNTGAIFLPSNDPEAWRDALEELAESPAWRHQLSMQARMRAARYCPSIMARNYLEAYNAVMAKPTPHLREELAA